MELREYCYSPKCAGKGPSKSINTSTGLWICFRCGATGKGIATSKLEKRPEVVAYEEPPEYWTIKSGSFAWDYLTKVRKVSEDVLENVSIFETGKGLLFFFHEFEGYWQERRWANYVPPWKNPEGDKRGIFYLVPHTQIENDIIVVEGVFDALRVAEFATSAALLGKQAFEEQAIKLAQLGWKKAWIFLDADTSTYDRAKVMRVLSQSLDVGVLPCPEGDPGGLTSETICAIVDSRLESK